MNTGKVTEGDERKEGTSNTNKTTALSKMGAFGNLRQGRQQRTPGKASKAIQEGKELAATRKEKKGIGKETPLERWLRTKTQGMRELPDGDPKVRSCKAGREEYEEDKEKVTGEEEGRQSYGGVESSIGKVN